jgi:cysteine desulfurase / selenocysteine lyase
MSVMNFFHSCRRDFPLLQRVVHGCPLVYLDSAATALKPQPVIDALVDFYSNYGVNISRGVYTLAEETTASYEQARSKVAHFLGATDQEIIFTKGATEGINAIAGTWGLDHIGSGDEILVTALEHHANLVPWQQCARVTGAKLQILPVHPDGTVAMENLPLLLTERTKLVAVSHVSNVFGTQVDVEHIIKAAHAVGAKVLVDAAQSVFHQKINVKTMGCDFLVFSGHKMMGPSGIGVLYISQNIADQVRPYQYGGAMVSRVTLQSALFAERPFCYEAGTPPIAGAIGLGAAIDYMNSHIDYFQLEKHEARLSDRLINGLESLKGVRVYGPVDQLKKNGHIVSFNISGIHPHDVAAYVDRFGVCLRAGFLCAQPLTEICCTGPLVRASISMYNTEKDIDILLKSLSDMIGEMGNCSCVQNF